MVTRFQARLLRASGAPLLTGVVAFNAESSNTFLLPHPDKPEASARRQRDPQRDQIP
jgi:hypothetical protein